MSPRQKYPLEQETKVPVTVEKYWPTGAIEDTHADDPGTDEVPAEQAEQLEEPEDPEKVVAGHVEQDVSFPIP